MSQERISLLSSRRATDFLTAFANYAWPDSDWKAFNESEFADSGAAHREWKRRYDKVCEAGAAWFERHRRYSAMFPKEPREVSPADRVFNWQQSLQTAWDGDSGESRREAVRGLIDAYIATAHAKRVDLSVGIPTLEKPRLALDADDFRGQYRRLSGGQLRRRVFKDGFRDALYRAYEIASKMRKCGNPKCNRPYFIARRSSDRFCSKACGLPAKRQSKLKWWEKHKKSILAKRRAERRKQRNRARRGESQREGKRQ